MKSCHAIWQFITKNELHGFIILYKTINVIILVILYIQGGDETNVIVKKKFSSSSSSENASSSENEMSENFDEINSVCGHEPGDEACICNRTGLYM